MGLSFIPTPSNAHLESIQTSLNDFERKIKLSYFFKERQNKSRTEQSFQKQPFTEKSTWEPPAKLIPENISGELSELKLRTQAVTQSRDSPNLTHSQIGALKNLKLKQHLIIKPADKGSATVIMNKSDYIFEAERQLNDENYYKIIDKPIYPETSKKISDILDSLWEPHFLTQKQINYLKPPKTPRARQFYLLPKIHKDVGKWAIPGKMPPGRPIVSDCSSESYRVSEYIDFHLKPVANKHPSYIKDTGDFLSKLREVKAPKDSLLVTLDIDSLYTNIKTDYGLESVKKMFDKHPNSLRPDKEILELLQLCLENNDFQFNGKWYLQTSGTAMGKKFAPNYANIDMAIFEEAALEKAKKKPLVFYSF